MSNHSPSDEPRSSAQADLGGGMHTYYREGNLPAGDNNSRKETRLTSQQQNQRARQLEEAHLRRKHTPMLEPSAEALQAMDPQKRSEVAEHIRELRGALELGGVEKPEISVEAPQLPFEN